MDDIFHQPIILAGLALVLYLITAYGILVWARIRRRKRDREKLRKFLQG